MEKRKLGKTGIEVSAVGVGGAEIGFEGATVSSATQIVDIALESGINLFDTAAAYLDSEKLLGEALRGRRNQAVIVSKCGFVEGFRRSDWSKEGILKTIQQSLSNLQTDYMDVVLLHSCSHMEFQWGEAGEALREAKARGYARSIGYSGEGKAAIGAIEYDGFEVVECSINVADQQAIDVILPHAIKSNFGIIAKRPIANVAWQYKTKPENAYIHAYWERFKELSYDFQKSDVESGIAVALNFVLGLKGVSSAIVGTNKSERVRSNAQLIKVNPISQDLIKKIRARWKEVSQPDWLGQE